MRLLVVALAILLGAPLASGTFVCTPDIPARACAGDITTSIGDCETQGSAAEGTHVIVVGVVASASASGERHCSRHPETGTSDTNIVRVGASGPGFSAYVLWTSWDAVDASGRHRQGCRMEVWSLSPAGANTLQEPCLAGDPPDPGWGHVLP